MLSSARSRPVFAPAAALTCVSRQGKCARRSYGFGSSHGDNDLSMTSQDWHPGIGDPTFMGWLTVLAYLLTSFLCGKAAKLMADSNELGKTGAVLFWTSCSILLLVLGVNKQLDLQSLFTGVGRDIAQAQGWYDRRRAVQALFLALLAFGGLATLVVFFRLTPGLVRECRTALIGASFLLCFVLMRAASFHHVDQLLGIRLTGLKMNYLLELGGISCVGLGALRCACRHRARCITSISPKN